ncbi:M48 family metalloprotease [Aquabacterium sp.]|uniref:M48 family metalloprotease n=1 Tax=Aquabacterium sp. TaxID=1872578 RepID=UPI0035B28A11
MRSTRPSHPPAPARRWRAQVCLIAALSGLPAPWLATPAAAQSALPALGESASGDFSPAAERNLGDSIMREIRRDPDYLDDPVLLEQVRTIWTRLANAARQRGEITPEMDAAFSWEPFLVRDRTVNAFALPGGFIGINLGLIAMTTSDDELASVLGHEMSHVTQRHIVRSIGQQQRLSMVAIASLILGVLAASRAPQAAEALIVGGQATSVQGQLNFSRDMEREADRVGYGVMTTAGYSPAGMSSMFEKLEQATHLNDDGSYPYLRTHPLTAERIGEAKARMGVKALSIPVDPVHVLLRQRARVLMDTRAAALHPILADASVAHTELTPLDQLARAYAAVLAAVALHDPKQAAALLDLLRSRAQALAPALREQVQRELLLLQAEVSLAALDRRGADAALAPLAADASRPVMLLRARRDLLPDTTTADCKFAAAALQTQVAREPGDATSWQLLALAWRRLDQPLRAVRAEAEASAALGDLPGAIDRLRSAQKQIRASSRVDFVEASVIDSRLRAFERDLRRQREENNGAQLR